jgi:hypothetical protein
VEFKAYPTRVGKNEHIGAGGKRGMYLNGIELSSAEFILRYEGLRNWNSGIMECWNNG